MPITTYKIQPKKVQSAANVIRPYKGRSIDLSKPVKVYRNLHTAKGTVLYSVIQGNLVVAHADRIHLTEVQFIVRESGRQKVLIEKRKNVHAFCTGYVTEVPGTMPAIIVKYNPYKYGYFYIPMPGEDWPVSTAKNVRIDSAGITAI